VGSLDHRQVADGQTIARSVDEPEAFATLFERHFPLVYRFLRLRAGVQQAGDLAAETFVVAFRRRADYDPTRADARPWLLGIAANLARAEQRSERRRRDTLLRLSREPMESVEDASTRPTELADAGLLTALADMSPEERDLLVLFGCVGLSYSEIADALSLPVGTVRSRIHRLRRKLRGRLARQVEEVSADVG
jgi:RNA polymerase sigma factor (sigma-70 family)